MARMAAAKVGTVCPAPSSALQPDRRIQRSGCGLTLASASAPTVQRRCAGPCPRCASRPRPKALGSQLSRRPASAAIWLNKSSGMLSTCSRTRPLSCAAQSALRCIASGWRPGQRPSAAGCSLAPRWAAEDESGELAGEFACGPRTGAAADGGRQAARAPGHQGHSGAGVVKILPGAMMLLLLCVTDSRTDGRVCCAVRAVRWRRIYWSLRRTQVAASAC